jgi:hypothetical protein
MLRTVSPNISIITNWGCRANCWYCIWKEHELEHVNEPTRWGKLGKFLYDNKEKKKVSISGGGDPLYKFWVNSLWWDKLLHTTSKLDMKVDIHTREVFDFDSFWKRINRCVISSDRLTIEQKLYFRYLLSLTKLRITHVVTANTTFEMIDEYLLFQKEYNKMEVVGTKQAFWFVPRCQFTIKELSGHDDNGMYKKIREKYPDIYYLDDGDYNIYYMPDNSIRTEFIGGKPQ